MTMFISWLIRFGHIVGAAMWVGGYALLAFFIIPLLGKGQNETLTRLAVTTVRFLTYAGTFTMGFGLVLIPRTNGFANLFRSAWGSLIITGFVIAVVLLGIGDSALRPAIRQISKRGVAPARRWAIAGFVLTILAVGVMTGATFVG